ncbi:hydantoinase/oxoprolinase N-terminal domain-containing protein [Streptomyces sp. NPDC056638]|uniref:hydantoinase/oxoprolinase N-terminal domain-containing protein n=1 Tax=Streptomyces sp. NPDC056638 TaxID=3345887 RepID=UPI0036A9ED3E
MTYRVAMDIGGTFTDVVAYDETRGTFDAAKPPTTPGDLAEGVFSSLGRAVDDPADISFFVHGTTQGLNALLERKGARVLLLASAGLRDVYQIARGNRDRMFDLHYRKPVPLVDRHATAEAAGRFDSRGTVDRSGSGNLCAAHSGVGSRCAVCPGGPGRPHRRELPR